MGTVTVPFEEMSVSDLEDRLVEIDQMIMDAIDSPMSFNAGGKTVSLAGKVSQLRAERNLYLRRLADLRGEDFARVERG